MIDMISIPPFRLRRSKSSPRSKVDHRALDSLCPSLLPVAYPVLMHVGAFSASTFCGDPSRLTQMENVNRIQRIQVSVWARCGWGRGGRSTISNGERFPLFFLRVAVQAFTDGNPVMIVPSTSRNAWAISWL